MPNEKGKSNWIDRKYLPNGSGKKAIFRLSAKGKRWFNRDTAEKTHRPRFSQLKVPHRLEVNELLILLKKENIISLDGFKLEKKLGGIRPDAYVEYDTPFCLEVDRCGTERQDFITRKWQQYEREFLQGNLNCRFVVWYSRRINQLYDWIDKTTQLEPIFIDSKEKIYKVIKHIKPGIKSVTK